MKYDNWAIRAGHNPHAPGASAILDEVKCNVPLKNAVIKYLKMAKKNVIDVTSSLADVNAELIEGVTKANNANVDGFASIHFNQAYEHYNGSLGAEVWLNTRNSEAVTIGKRVLAKLEELGFRNRGVKDGVHVPGQRKYENRATTMTSMIIEVCFVEATEDARLYMALGPEVVGKAIAEGIVGHTIGGADSGASTPVVTYDDKTIPQGSNIWRIPNTPFYIERATDGRMLIHYDRGNYLVLGQGFVDVYWNDNKGKRGNKRLSD